MEVLGWAPWPQACSARSCRRSCVSSVRAGHGGLLPAHWLPMCPTGLAQLRRDKGRNAGPEESCQRIPEELWRPLLHRDSPVRTLPRAWLGDGSASEVSVRQREKLK